MSTRWFIALSVVLAIFDQATKFLARRLVDHETLQALLREETNAVKNVIIPNFYSLTLTFNPGIAWGMLPQWSEYFTYFAIVMVLVILMIMRKLDRDEVWLKIALAFQMAGAFGNMTDRLIFKKVTDFIDVILFPNMNVHYQWHLLGKNFRFDLPYDWPIFNLADSFVVVGTTVLVLVLFFTKDTQPETVPAAVTVTGPLMGLPDEREKSRMTGSIPDDEGLKEIPGDATSEMLVPFEDADTIRTDELGADDEKGMLRDLSKRPEKSE